MTQAPPIPVVAREGQELNGLGMMVLQYLEQVFAEYPLKAETVPRIRCRIGMEVEKGIAVTVSFQGDKVVLENGVGENPTLHIKGPYLLLSRILCGTASPFVELLRGRIKLMAFPRRPIQSLKVLHLLKIPPEVRADT